MNKISESQWNITRLAIIEKHFNRLCWAAEGVLESSDPLTLYNAMKHLEEVMDKIIKLGIMSKE